MILEKYSPEHAVYIWQFLKPVEKLVHALILYLRHAVEDALL